MSAITSVKSSSYAYQSPKPKTSSQKTSKFQEKIIFASEVAAALNLRLRELMGRELGDSHCLIEEALHKFRSNPTMKNRKELEALNKEKKQVEKELHHLEVKFPVKLRFKVSSLHHYRFDIELFFLNILVKFFNFCDWVEAKIRGEPLHRAMRRNIQTLVCEDDPKKTVAYFRQVVREITKNPGPAPKGYKRTRSLTLDLLAMKELHPKIHEVLSGANVALKDGGRFYRKWESLDGAYWRPSSHDHKKEDCCAVKTGLYKEWLVWIDRKGNTRFQLEKSPIQGRVLGIGNKIKHIADYVRYVRDGKQQGPYGDSDHVEHYPLSVSIDWGRFQSRRATLRSELIK